MSCALAAIGATIIIFPFTTPLTNRLIGVKNAVVAARIAGLALVVGGIVFAIAGA